MKVYLATHGSHSDFEVLRVFANREDAEAYELADNVDEFEVGDKPVETRPWHSISWYPDEPDGEHEREFRDGRTFTLTNPRPEYASCRDYDGRPNHVEHQWHPCKGSGRLYVEGWDIERVRKVYGEQRAVWLSNKTLGMVWDPEKLEWTAPEVEA
ncbi:DUF7336 domain-containing protein [Streptosporangium sp. NPDC004631]